MENEKQLIENKKKIKKCIRSYQEGLKLIEINKNKSFEYFNQSLKYKNLVSKDNTEKHILEALEETENECNKYINLTIEKTIEREDIINIDIDLFDAIEKGEPDLLKNIKSYNFLIYDEDGNTLIHKAIKWGDTKFIKMMLTKGAPINITNKAGTTPLEFAVLNQNQTIIDFLLDNGADMKKHLEFRKDNNKTKSFQNYIDCSIILKIIFSNVECDDIKELTFIFDYLKKEELIGFNEYTYENLIKCLATLLNKINNDNKKTYLRILKEELRHNLKFNLCCPYNKLEILLTYLVPFIDYPFNITEEWYINLELKYLIIKEFKKKNILDNQFYENVDNYLQENYIDNNILKFDYLHNLIARWVSKIKV
jgi:ankyrin repeat protein